MTQLKIIRYARYRSALDNDEGWCKTCQKFTGEMVEPDAEDRACEECGEDTVVGAENAMVEELFKLIDVDDEFGQDKEDDNG